MPLLKILRHLLGLGGGRRIHCPNVPIVFFEMFGILLNTLVVPPRASHHPFWCPPLSLSSFLVSLIVVPHHLSIAQNKLFLLHPISLAISPYHTLTTPCHPLAPPITTCDIHHLSITSEKTSVFFFQCSTSTPHPSLLHLYISLPCPQLRPSAPLCMFVKRKSLFSFSITLIIIVWKNNLNIS